MSKAGAPGGRSQSRKPTVVLFGDSHAYAIQRAIEKRRGKHRAVPVTAHRLAKVKNGKQQGDTSFETFLEMVRPLQPSDFVFSTIGGNQHAVFSTIQHAERFDFFEPSGGIKTDASASIIPYRTLAAVFEKGIRNGDGKSLEALRKATSARLIHVVPPPPKKDNQFIQQYHETHFAKEGIASLGVSPPGLRLKFWALQTQLLQKVCSEFGIEIMLPPPSALDEKGFLATDYYANDATHANHAYGELILAGIESYLSQSAAPSAQVQS